MTESIKAQAVGALRQCAKEHEKDFTPTFNIRVSDLCNDIAGYIEELQKENEELKEKLKGFESGDVTWQGDMDATIAQNLDLKEHIESLANINIKTQDIIAELKEQNKDLCESLGIMNNRESELLEQIEKMKRCENCRYWLDSFENHCICEQCERENKWELAE